MSAAANKQSWEVRDFDACDCGDYRHQHENGTGRCKLGSLCTPSHCQKFRLHQQATEIPAPYNQPERTAP